MALAALGDSQEPVAISGNYQPSIYVLDPNEKNLISEPERQMLQKWWIEIRLEPTMQWTLGVRLDMSPDQHAQG